MLFGNSKYILHLKSKSLEVYKHNTQGVQARINFPPDYQKDQEIVDEQKFEQLISNFLTKLNLKDSQCLIAVSGENLFEKSIPLTNSKKEQAEAEEFFTQIPFDTEKIIKKQIRVKNGIKLIAANKNLYEAIVHVLQVIPVEIEAVIPITSFGITSSTLTKKDTSDIMKNSSLIKLTNFMTRENQPSTSNKKAGEDKSTQTPIKTDTKKKYLLIGGIIIIVVGLVIAALLLLKPDLLNKSPQNNIPDNKELTNFSNESKENISGDSEASKEAEILEKSEITISILNGSGISGQASSIQSQLQSLKYSQIEAGNAQNQNRTTTLIQSSSNIPENYISEIKTELGKTLDSIETETSSTLETSNIIITTGKPI